MILFLTLVSAAVAYLAVAYVVDEAIKQRDRDAYVKAYSRHGGHRKIWTGTDWSKLERIGERNREERAR